MQSAFKRALAALSFLLFSFCSHATHANVYVISNENLKVSEQDLADIFLGNMLTAGTQKIVAIENKSVQLEFLAKVLKVSLVKYNSIWAKKSFREAAQIPAQKSSDSEVVDFVKYTPGAIGYVGTKPVGVRVIKEY